MSRPVHFNVAESFVLINGQGGRYWLEDGYNKAILGISGLGVPQTEYQAIAGFSGFANVQNHTHSAREIQIDFRYQGKTRADYHAARQALVNFVRPDKDNPLILRRTVRDGTQRSIDLYAKDTPAFQDERDGNPTGFIEQLRFYAPDPRFYNPTEQSQTLSTTTSGGFGFPYAFPYSYPPAGFAQDTITYAGNIKSYPRIVVTGPFSTLTLTHIEASAQIWISQAITATQSVTIDLTPASISVTRSDGEDMIDATGRSNFVDFALYPDSSMTPDGANSIVAAGIGTTGTTSVTVYYYERYLSL